jgi:branched-chain amino acid transport system substrate-binding protein
MKTKRALSVLTVILFIAILMTCLFMGCTKKEEPKEIKIGALLPLSGDGAKYGEEAKDGFDLAAEKINTEGGINGKKIKIVYEDDLGTSVGAVNGFNKIVTTEKVPVVLGPMFSSTTLAVAPKAEEKKIVLFSPSASTPALTKAGDYIFRNWPSDIFEGGEMAKYAYEKLGLRKIAILAVNLDYGSGLTKVFQESFSKLGGEILLEDTYEQGNTDFRTQLSKIKAKQPDAIYLPGYYAEIGLILKQAKELGVKTRFLSCVGFDSPKALEIAGRAAEGVIFGRPAYEPESKAPKVTNFVQEFKSKYNINPGTYAAHAYDALNIVAEAVKKGGYTADGIKTALYLIKNFQGVTGDTTFDQNGDVIKPIQIMKVEKQRFLNAD